MAKCPKCNKDIDSLNNFQSGENKYVLSLNNDGTSNYEANEFQENGLINDFECPECSETLFISENDAIKFLKGDLNG